MEERRMALDVSEIHVVDKALFNSKVCAWGLGLRIRFRVRVSVVGFKV
jgi:hypothetical protein